MDFDVAVNRLNREHARRARRGRGVNDRSRRSVLLSESARREAEENRRRDEERRRSERVRKERLRRLRSYVSRCERELGTVRGLNDDGDDSYVPTSVHGDGDKIALPPSVLESLMRDDDGLQKKCNDSPFEFRVGVPNPDYVFPASPKMRRLLETLTDDNDDQENDQVDVEEEEEEEEDTAAFLDELSHRYLGYTHCGVVEFTQEEGRVGLPASVAARLLSSTASIPTTRTVDPAATSSSPSSSNTPGHVAWGAFDVPDARVEVVKVVLPKGRGCALRPTKESVENGFHRLPDVKLVLEQSLVRTRATLSVGDVVHGWRRGIRFDLVVSRVDPVRFGAVSCVNTDVEVDLLPLDDDDGDNDEETKTETKTEPKRESPSRTVGSGRAVGSVVGSHKRPAAEDPLVVPPPSPSSSSSWTLPPEPPANGVGVVDALLRGPNGRTARRRFDRSIRTVADLLAFAAREGVAGDDVGTTAVRLVTRAPRLVLDAARGSETLKEAGVEEGRVVFLTERAP